MGTNADKNKIDVEPTQEQTSWSVTYRGTEYSITRTYTDNIDYTDWEVFDIETDFFIQETELGKEIIKALKKDIEESKHDEVLMNRIDDLVDDIHKIATIAGSQKLNMSEKAQLRNIALRVKNLFNEVIEKGNC